MNQTETSVFFRLLHDLEELGYTLERDDLDDAFARFKELADRKREITDLDNFINQVDAYAVDFDGEYGKGYQAAVDLYLEAVNQLIESEEV